MSSLQYNVKTRLILTLIGLKVRGIRYFLAEDSVLISIQTVKQKIQFAFGGGELETI